MKIVLERFSNETETLLYQDFLIQDQVRSEFLKSSNNSILYELLSIFSFTFQIFYRLKVGTYEGNEDFNTLKDHNGTGTARMGFSTYDFGDSRDRKKKCAEIFGHWWHSECQIDNFSNPNGANLGLGIVLF